LLSYFCMAVWALKRDNETNEKLIKRWKRQVNNARIMQKIRDERYQKGDPSKRVVRIAAIKRSGFQEKRRKEQFYA